MLAWEASVSELSQHCLDEFSMLEDQQVYSVFVSQGKHTVCVLLVQHSSALQMWDHLALKNDEEINGVSACCSK